MTDHAVPGHPWVFAPPFRQPAGWHALRPTPSHDPDAGAEWRRARLSELLALADEARADCVDQRTRDRLRETITHIQATISRLATNPSTPDAAMLQPHSCDLRRVLDRIADIAPELLGKRVQFHYVARVDHAWVEIDAVSCEQLVMNLLINAREAARDNGTIVLHLAPSRASHGREAQILVTDNGEGMTEDVRLRVFDQWFTTRSDPGRGLGLWVVRTVLERHGGRVHVSSKPGAGSRFTLTIPLAQPTARSDGDLLSPGTLRWAGLLRGVRGLVVADSPTIALEAAQSLLAADADVTVVPSAESALREVHQTRVAPDFVVIDDGCDCGDVSAFVAELRSRSSTAVVCLLSDGGPLAWLPDRGHIALSKPLGRGTLVGALLNAIYGLQPVARTTPSEGPATASPAPNGSNVALVVAVSAGLSLPEPLLSELASRSVRIIQTSARFAALEAGAAGPVPDAYLSAWPLPLEVPLHALDPDHRPRHVLVDDRPSTAGAADSNGARHQGVRDQLLAMVRERRAACATARSRHSLHRAGAAVKAAPDAAAGASQRSRLPTGALPTTCEWLVPTVHAEDAAVPRLAVMSPRSGADLEGLLLQARSQGTTALLYDALVREVVGRLVEMPAEAALLLDLGSLSPTICCQPALASSRTRLIATLDGTTARRWGVTALRAIRARGVRLAPVALGSWRATEDPWGPSLQPDFVVTAHRVAAAVCRGSMNSTALSGLAATRVEAGPPIIVLDRVDAGDTPRLAALGVNLVRAPEARADT
jgi:hypothetical protein